VGRRGRLSFSSDQLYFVTTAVVNHAQVFTEERFCDVLVENIKHYRNRYQFRIYGYVIMPSHFHWIVEVEPNLGLVSDVMRDIKKFAAWDVMDLLEKENRQALLSMFRAEALALDDQKRKFWMDRFDDEVIRNVGMLRTKLEYIHNNPVQAGLVGTPEEYKYSSARNYALGDHSVIEVFTDWE
jgi:putative transposase